MLLKRIGEQIKKFASESVTWLRTEEEVTDQISVEIESTLVQQENGRHQLAEDKSHWIIDGDHRP